ncbi:Putative ascorbate peroxidase [Seminavis robusta]|uniref:Ascorbate peroxidase n=1 Tax=Seminavis robusta TaxID=568900 RepID=A0A9N8DIH9_9STRA|nr:Putative ascorbate peroxidase [Seminavis robusta]|eukprot:Sro161_g072390.1 Putative ascorbate peroxidase (527) ;mRNA; r:19151-21157
MKISILLKLVTVGIAASVSAAQTLQLSRLCFEIGQEIAIIFQNGRNPSSTDWIGLYPHDDINPTEEPLIWYWTCGNQDCDVAMARGTVMFSQNDPIEGWPLSPGSYRAVLAKDDPMFYRFIDISVAFRVVNSLQECPNNGLLPEPTRAPVSISRQTAVPVSTTTVPVPPLAPQPASTLPPSTAPTTRTRMSEIIASAKADIIELINEKPVLRALYLRMIFHDCVGGTGCDGCINTENPDNGGLGSSMGSLREIERRYGPDLSRADIWVLASFVGVEQAMPAEGDGERIDLPFHFYGREDCDDRLDRGPDPPLCSPNLGTDEVLEYFARHFDFDARETGAIMGGHTIGVARRNILGFDGPFGWVPNNTRFDNEYYRELVGEGPTDRFQVEWAPQWRQIEINNTELNGTDVPNRWQWEGFPNGRRVVMLNSDVALVRQLDSANMEESGFVSCKFVSRAPGESVCPASRNIIFSEMVRYRNNNTVFLEDFRDAMVKMTNVGYTVDGGSCDEDGICRLVRRAQANSTGSA